MKSSLVPIACGTALALMAGAATAHWSSVRDMAALAALLPANLPAAENPSIRPAAPTAVPDDKLAREAKSFLAEARRDSEKSGSGAGQDVLFERYLTLMEGMAGQNQELREQIAQTNRDVYELRFQVDSYDGQFRPLKVEEEPSYYDDGSSGVLPPIDPY